MQVSPKYTMLDAVTTATESSTYAISRSKTASIQVDLSGVAGNVTVTIYANINGAKFAALDQRILSNTSDSYIFEMDNKLYDLIKIKTDTHTAGVIVSATLLTSA